MPSLVEILCCLDGEIGLVHDFWYSTHLNFLYFLSK